MERKENIRQKIEEVLKHKTEIVETSYSKSLEELVEDLKIYQYELEFQNEELLRIQFELEASRNDYRQLFQNAPVGYIVVDDALKIIEANNNFRMLVSNNFEFKYHDDFRKFIHPGSQDRFHFFYNSILKHGNTEHIEVQLNSTDDSPIIVSIFGNVFRKTFDSNQLRFTVINITEKIMAENALAAREAELRTITENMTDIIVVCDVDGKITYASTSCKFIEYEPQELIGKNIFEMVFRDDLAHLLSRFKNALITKHSDSVEFRANTKSGKMIWVEAYGDLVLNKLGDIEKIIFVVRDISDRKKAEHVLSETKEKLLQTSRLARVGGWELDVNSNSVEWSDVTREIHEAPADYMPTLESGLSFYKEGENRNRLSQLIKQAINFGTPFEDEFQIVTYKGNVKWVKAQGSSVFNDGKCIKLFGTFQDIDEKRKAEEIIKVNEARLKELNATKDKLFSIIAHDLKSPFNSILGFSDLLIDQIEKADHDEIESFAKHINYSSKRVVDLVHNLLEWARIQNGKIAFNPVETNFYFLAENVADTLSATAKQKLIRLVNKIPVNITANADQFMIETILRNLVLNAIKFTHPQGEVTVMAEKRNQEIVFSVKDNGVGISENKIHKLFRLDENYTTSGTQNEKGTGLGLILCKEFVERHDGRIWVESEENVGSVFYFSIPVN